MFVWKDEKEAGTAHFKKTEAFSNENCSQHSKVTKVGVNNLGRQVIKDSN